MWLCSWIPDKIFLPLDSHGAAPDRAPGHAVSRNRQARQPAYSAARVHHRRLGAGVPLRDVWEAALHADPRTTMRYDRARKSLDRHGHLHRRQRHRRSSKVASKSEPATMETIGLITRRGG